MFDNNFLREYLISIKTLLYSTYSTNTTSFAEHNLIKSKQPQVVLLTGRPQFVCGVTHPARLQKDG